MTAAVVTTALVLVGGIVVALLAAIVLLELRNLPRRGIRRTSQIPAESTER